MAVLFRISRKGLGYADGTLCCSHLETMDFWVDLIKTETDEWYWGDGVALDLNQVSSLPMTPAYNQSYSSWNCALWNMAEPFLMPADCRLAANIICQVPTTEPGQPRRFPLVRLGAVSYTHLTLPTKVNV